MFQQELGEDEADEGDDVDEETLFEDLESMVLGSGKAAAASSGSGASSDMIEQQAFAACQNPLPSTRGA